MRRLAGVAADSGPVLVLAGIAAAGSFTHIRDTASEHGQGGWMAWAIAVCIDLTCVMAARERQRDKRTGRATGRLSWPTLVLVGGILLSLAANLAQADPTAWGWITAGTPAAAFLVAVSMLERRATAHPADASNRSASSSSSAGVMTAPPSFGDLTADPSPSVVPPGSSPASQIQDEVRPEIAAAVPARPDEQDGAHAQTTIPVPAPTSAPSGQERGPSSAAGPLVEFARRVAAEHASEHGRPITRDALRGRLGVSNQLASDLLRQIRNQTA
ncbi:DUF2637 domain-containing protein [Spirillospora sp. NPDC029432]|uniref:DUF2637 domain-containing protein n=1 Tax=Spirillospora sp. NPDC029432 TaxID=3154599 RepID=UPI003454FE63